MIDRYGLQCFQASNLLRTLQYMKRVGIERDAETLDGIRLAMTEHVVTCEALGLKESKKLLARILVDWNAGQFASLQARDRFGVLHERLRDELESVWFKVLSSDEAKQYKATAPFGSVVNNKFSSATYDIQEAAKCLALDRSTACVLHLMRVLQLGLNVFANSLNVPFDRKDWHQVLKGIEDEIDLRKSQKHDDDARIFLDFCSSAAVDFRHFKDAWRNHAMHARENYTPERAINIYDHVGSFMQHLSTRFEESPVNP